MDRFSLAQRYFLRSAQDFQVGTDSGAGVYTVFRHLRKPPSALKMRAQLQPATLLNLLPGQAKRTAHALALSGSDALCASDRRLLRSKECLRAVGSRAQVEAFG